MTRPSRRGLWAYLIALAVLVADQASKYWILYVYDLPAKGSVAVTPFFDLSMVWNRGVSFGLFRSPDGQETVRWMLAGFSAIVALALIAWAWRVERRWSAVAIGLIIGGAIGNLIDRVRFGAVADFLDFSGLYFPWVFNVADSGISVGVVLLLAETLFNQPKDKSAA